MSKKLNRYQEIDNEDYNANKIKALKKRKMDRKLVRLEYEDYLNDDELPSYVNDRKFFRAIKEFNQ